MKHYHGTPIGGKRANADEFCEGRFVLIPWKRPEDLERALSLSRGVIVDNSAFSFWSTGETPDWNDYLKWCQSIANHPRFEFAIVPDVIDGTEKENDDLIKWWNSKSRHNPKIRSCVVWHLHESLDRLNRLVRSHWEFVALGSSGEFASPGQSDGWWARMDEAFSVICGDDGIPKKRIHGLRMLRPEIVKRYPFASCDSTNAVQNGTRESLKNNVDALWGKQTIARRIELSQSPSVWFKSEVQETFLK